MSADLSQFEDLIRINVTGALSLLQKAALKMVDTQQDAFPDSAADIVIIGSVVGRNVSPFSTVYGASKFAVHALAEGLRREASPKGIRVSLVEPGLVMRKGKRGQAKSASFPGGPEVMTKESGDEFGITVSGLTPETAGLPCSIRTSVSRSRSIVRTSHCTQPRRPGAIVLASGILR